MLAVTNLVINALDAMDNRGQLTVATEADIAAKQVLVHIGDTGSGIPDDVLPFIFEPFFTTKEVGRGTGLGLSIVHGIITRAGGRIDVESSKTGTTFSLRLPIGAEQVTAAVA